MDFNNDIELARLALEFQHHQQQREELEAYREDLLLQEKQERRTVNKSLIQSMMEQQGFDFGELSRGLTILNTLREYADLSVGELFDSISEIIEPLSPTAALAAESLWIASEQ